ncbi:RING-H2 finger protein ATL13-like [Tripterygium wilfordii]|uniref:RING-H2 finger protein ATL13-like n=1 Tax=Tripterygium wilfordii TaxID=458696 RepID=UPI0018F80443|nr:RING-H2 finger protein ATL13-like [Tripterygium wilfordii]
MGWVHLPVKVSPPFFLPLTLPPPPPQQNFDFNLDTKVRPSILLIIVVLAIIFFVSGLLHLLVRLLLSPPNRDPEEMDNVTALQGQLQQLFHLHDAGVDQSFIDTLPVFNYKAIIGLRDPFDCAVCLCEFEPEDKLRLLPKCSHAFHMACIDTWLLSHSTCPLCRASLLHDSSPNNSCSPPIVLVLESGSESSRELEGPIGRTSSVMRTNSFLGFHRDIDLGSTHLDFSHKSCEIVTKEESCPTIVLDSGDKVVPVKLGKFRNVDGGEGSSSSSNCNNDTDVRRCFSMGSFEYVMDENTLLQVPIRTPMKKQSSKKPSLPLTPGHRLAMSECGFDSRREFNGFDAIGSCRTNGSSSICANNGSAISSAKKDSLSVSKIWLQDKQSETEDSSRRAFSFRFPWRKSVDGVADEKGKNVNCGGSAFSEIDSELGCCDEENQSCNSLDSQAKTPSFARRTLLWLVGRQNKVVHSSYSSNI